MQQRAKIKTTEKSPLSTHNKLAGKQVLRETAKQITIQKKTIRLKRNGKKSITILLQTNFGNKESGATEFIPKQPGHKFTLPSKAPAGLTLFTTNF
jgi:hypothetical protein